MYAEFWRSLIITSCTAHAMDCQMTISLMGLLSISCNLQADTCNTFSSDRRKGPHILLDVSLRRKNPLLCKLDQGITFWWILEPFIVDQYMIMLCRFFIIWVLIFQRDFWKEVTINRVCNFGEWAQFGQSGTKNLCSTPTSSGA